MPHPSRLNVFIIVIGWAQFYILISTLTYLSLTPDPGAAFQLVSDKLLHIVGWAGLSLSLWLAWRRLGFLWACLLVLFVYSIVIEVLQQMTGRQFSVADMAANAVGITLGYCMATLLNPLYQRLLQRLLS